MNTILRTALLLGMLASHAFAGGGNWQNWVVQEKKDLAAEGKVMAHLIDWRNRIYTAATPEQMAKCPAWDQQSEPPLSMATAIQSARSRVQRDNPTFGHITLDNIKCDQGHSSKWVYTVRLRGQAPDDDGGSTRAEFAVDVMMDGTILERRFGPPFTQKLEQIETGEPEITRNGSAPPIEEGKLHGTERRMRGIIIPEVDFRQAALIDVVSFLDCVVSEYGAGIEKNDNSRVKIQMGRFFTTEELRGFLPPHAVYWSGTPGIPLLAFSSRA